MTLYTYKQTEEELWTVGAQWHILLGQLLTLIHSTQDNHVMSQDYYERLAALPAAEAAGKMQTIAGIGVWTAAEVVQRTHGCPDSIAVGDYHLAAYVGAALTGRRTDDAGMLALTHLSPRYFGPDVADEARAIFPETVVPRDFDVIEVPFPERGPPRLLKGAAAPVKKQPEATPLQVP